MKKFIKKVVKEFLLEINTKPFDIKNFIKKGVKFEKLFYINVNKKLKRVKNRRDFLLKLMPNHSICAEIGVYKGKFSIKILEKVEPKKLHLIDPWKYQEAEDFQEAAYGGKAGSQEVMNKIYSEMKARLRKEIEKGKVEIHRGFSHLVYKDFPDKYFDWIYIDGNHQYDYVRKDLKLFFPKVKIGGYITGDDYKEIGWWEGGVKKAVDEYIKNERVKKIKIKNGQFILQKLEKKYED